MQANAAIAIPYNTSRPQLRLPEYGRMVTEMVERCKQMPHREMRNLYARQIIHVMEGMNEDLRGTENYKGKLWDHLALLGGYELDIDYPQPIRREEGEQHVEKLSYPGNKIRFRHYGCMVEKMLKRIEELPEGVLRDELVLSAAKRMRLDLIDWRGDRGNLDEKVAGDIEDYTAGHVNRNDVLHLLERAPRTRGRKKRNGY